MTFHGLTEALKASWLAMNRTFKRAVSLVMDAVVGGEERMAGLAKQLAVVR